MVKVAVLCALALAACSAARGGSGFEVSNGYFEVSGAGGVITSMRMDPSGAGRYGRNHIIGILIGDAIPDPNAVSEVQPDRIDAALHKAAVALRGVKTRRTVKVEQLESNAPELLREGHTLGQEFEFRGGALQSVEAKLPTWHTDDSAVTMTLYRIDGGGRKTVASRRFENLRDNAWVALPVADAAPGRFALELSDAEGMVGWWSAGHDLISGDATTDGVAHPAMDRTLRCYGSDIVSGDLDIALDGPKMRVTFTPEAGAAAPDSTRIVIPWIKSGYDITSDRIIFSHFLTNRGLYMPVHQFKRRPFSGVSGEWVVMSGRFGSDLKFTNANIHLEMDEDRMTLSFPGASREIELLPHSDDLGEQFPVFYSSDPKIDKVLNLFLLSHNFNFGVGTNPDWKDWHTLQLSWTANGQCDWQHQQFLDFRMSDDGYVYCWGADAGWPFPYKDDDKDGANDFDTRHFTTNPCYILGAWREYCWTREPDYLAKLMPRVRLAMEFMLRQMDGDRGVLTSHAPGHEGRDRDIGSNYWDISPFGFKDAFTNVHYYPALEAMAQLEEAALSIADCGLRSAQSPTQRTPYFYRRLAEKVRADYNKVFWLDGVGRYAGCVDIDGIAHDYGFTYVNLPAMAYGLASPAQVRRIYDWMEHGVTSSGKADTYSRWVFAPRACTIHNPRRDEPQAPVPSWWSMVWAGTGYDEQCQDGGAILYTSFHDILARARYLGADNAWKRLTEILGRYSRPDHLSGGSPLYYGEITQGGPGGTAGSVGVEGEFPESGLVPVSFFYAFLGIDADIHGMTIRPNLPSALKFAGVRNVRFAGKMYDIRITNTSVEVHCTSKGFEHTVRRNVRLGETFHFSG